MNVEPSQTPDSNFDCLTSAVGDPCEGSGRFKISGGDRFRLNPEAILSILTYGSGSVLCHLEQGQIMLPATLVTPKHLIVCVMGILVQFQHDAFFGSDLGCMWSCLRKTAGGRCPTPFLMDLRVDRALWDQLHLTHSKLYTYSMALNDV